MPNAANNYCNEKVDANYQHSQRAYVKHVKVAKRRKQQLTAQWHVLNWFHLTFDIMLILYANDCN